MLAVIEIPDEILEENASDSYYIYNVLDASIKIDDNGRFCGMHIYEEGKEIELNWDIIEL